MNFHESAKDRFINQRLHDNRLSTVETFIARSMKKSAQRPDVLDILGLRKLK